jgi:hypothetical protein
MRNRIQLSIATVLFGIILVPALAMGAETKTLDLKRPVANEAVHPMQTVKPGVQKAAKTIRKAVITNFTIGTETDGRWFWRATVQNTGNQAFQARELSLQAQQIQFAPALHPAKPGSGSLVMRTLAPGASTTIKSMWNRCCQTNELAIALKDVPRNHVLDRKSISNLIHYNGYYTQVFDTKTKRIEWNNTAKTWQATFQNNTPYYLSMLVQGQLIKGNNAPLPAGGQRMVIGPNQTKSSMKFHANNAVNGDKIKVIFYFDSNNSFCKQSVRDCGGETGNIITVPHSRNF